ncbi:MAG TPA: energy transducer TonB [Rhizomicrobium sp.]|jgi:protein TonB
MVCRTILYGTAVAATLLFIGTAMADDRPPAVDTSRPTPVTYPKSSQEAGEEGKVVVAVLVSDSGVPVRATVYKSSGHSDLDDAAMSTALNWHYVPAIEGGETTQDWVTVGVDYKLPEQQPKDTAAK